MISKNTQNLAASNLTVDVATGVKGVLPADAAFMLEAAREAATGSREAPPSARTGNGEAQIRSNETGISANLNPTTGMRESGAGQETSAGSQLLSIQRSGETTWKTLALAGIIGISAMGVATILSPTGPATVSALMGPIGSATSAAAGFLGANWPYMMGGVAAFMIGVGSLMTK